MKFKYILAAVAASVAISASAVPAKRDLRTIIQPDGTELTIQKVGDESRHFTLTADGMLLTRDANGQYSYARIDKEGKLVSTGIRALNARLVPKGLRILPVKTVGDRELLYLYRPARLRRESDFPHEVGLFLGYPPRDVEGFIREKARRAKCTGAWKVYGDEEAARKGGFSARGPAWDEPGGGEP